MNIGDIVTFGFFFFLVVSLTITGYNAFNDELRIQDLETNLTYVIMLNDDMINNIIQINRDIYHQNMTIERIKSNLTTYISENNKLLSETQILCLKLNDKMLVQLED